MVQPHLSVTVATSGDWSNPGSVRINRVISVRVGLYCSIFHVLRNGFYNTQTNVLLYFCRIKSLMLEKKAGEIESAHLPLPVVKRQSAAGRCNRLSFAWQFASLISEQHGYFWAHTFHQVVQRRAYSVVGVEIFTGESICERILNTGQYFVKVGAKNIVAPYSRTQCICASFIEFLPRDALLLSLIHIWRCRRSYACRSRWSPYH